MDHRSQVFDGTMRAMQVAFICKDNRAKDGFLPFEYDCTQTE